MSRFTILALLVLSVYASNLRLETEKGIMERKALVEAMYSKQTGGGDESNMDVWREEVQQVVGWNTYTYDEQTWMFDTRSDQAMRYDAGGYYAVPEEEVPDWVWDRIDTMGTPEGDSSTDRK